MSRKPLETPEYESFKSISDVDAEMWKQKDKLAKTVKSHLTQKDTKKDTNKSMNDEIKETAEEIDHIVGVLDALEDRRKMLAANPHLSVVGDNN